MLRLGVLSVGKRPGVAAEGVAEELGACGCGGGRMLEESAVLLLLLDGRPDEVFGLSQAL